MACCVIEEDSSEEAVAMLRNHSEASVAGPDVERAKVGGILSVGVMRGSDLPKCDLKRASSLMAGGIVLVGVMARDGADVVVRTEDFREMVGAWGVGPIH